jgi:enolase
MDEESNRKELYNYLKGNKVSHFMEIDYHNIINGVSHNELYEPYDSYYVNKVTEYFKNLEDFEKCSKLRGY